MKKSKYMVSLGLAFFEQAEMNRLQKKSTEGWHLKEFAFGGYRLKKGDPEEWMYTIDYHLLKKDEKEEYLELFQLGGWEHVCSQYNMHIFRAPKGTEPIYNDADTKQEKYKQLAALFQKCAIIFFILLLCSIGLIWQFTGKLQSLGNVLLLISLPLFIPSLMTYVVIIWKKKQLQKEVD